VPEPGTNQALVKPPALLLRCLWTLARSHA
jgi:hypothetical protein